MFVLTVLEAENKRFKIILLYIHHNADTIIYNRNISTYFLSLYHVFFLSYIFFLFCSVKLHQVKQFPCILVLIVPNVKWSTKSEKNHLN